MKYSLIYADPAWEYGNTISNGAARGITVVKTELAADPVAIIKGLLSGGDMARDNAVEWLKKQGVAL